MAPGRLLTGATAVFAVGWRFLGANAVVRMPEEFNVEKDFAEKEVWRNAVVNLRCPLCTLTLSDTFEQIGQTFQEDDVYDTIQKLCDKEELYDKYEIVKSGTGFDIVQVDAPAVNGEELKRDPRSDHTRRWQTHAMKEACDNLILPNDDEIKDYFLKARRKKMDQQAFTSGVCAKLKFCKKPKAKKAAEL
eukprot:TRINITY_DN173_c0_g1_i3.p1 TRINITY_DN173_c0_g1~~TRINITY_DN173_c0_g1_i3.p1  ORF type:complete len:190 (+),score=51.52 TRINITY_DN173_c0_g1_i3:84-653(+)